MLRLRQRRLLWTEIGLRGTCLGFGYLGYLLHAGGDTKAPLETLIHLCHHHRGCQMAVLLLPSVGVQGNLLLEQPLHLPLGALWAQVCKKRVSLELVREKRNPLVLTLHILAGAGVCGQLDILRWGVVQTDNGQIVTVHQLDKHTRYFQTDVEVGEGHVHLQRGERQSTLRFPHNECLVITARDGSGAYVKQERIMNDNIQVDQAPCLHTICGHLNVDDRSQMSSQRVHLLAREQIPDNEIHIF